MKKRALLVCYYFPPLGLAGVTRPLNLYKKLPSHGWECDVLTVKPVAYRAYEPELLNDVNTDRVFRAGSRDPQRLLYLLGVRKIRSSTADRAQTLSERYFPDNKIGWVRPAIRVGRRLVRDNEYRAIISTSPPVSAHLVARELSRESKLPWLADFRDFWSLHKVEDSFSSARLVDRGKQLLADIVGESNIVTVVNDAIGDYLGAGETVLNGYDIDLASGWKKPTAAEQFVIGLLGTLKKRDEIVPLLRIIAAVRDRSPQWNERLRLLQVGQVDRGWFEEELVKHDLQDCCDIMMLQGRRETVQLLSRARLMYISHLPTEKEVLPSRVFDMLASGRPILAHAPKDSCLGRLVDECGNGFCFDHQQLDEAVEFLLGKMQSWEDGSDQIEPLPDYAQEYSSENLARKFASLLDSLS